MATCEICGKRGSIIGGQMAFKCRNCKKMICKECVCKFGNPTAYGGFFGDKHAEITCPNCHYVIKLR